MRDKRHSAEVKTGGPEYVGWRSELLAELALARLPELSVYRPKQDSSYDFLVAAPSGVCFFVEVKGFSSREQGLRDIADVAELQAQTDSEDAVRARQSPTPVVLFLIDADTDHGRFLRLDTLPAFDQSSTRRILHFPREQTLDKAGIERLVAELERTVPAASRR